MDYPSDGRPQARASVVKADTAEQRERAFSRARWNTVVIRILRRVVPLSAVALVIGYGASAFQGYDFSSALPSLPIPQITTQDLTMKNPRYSGFTQDGGRYEVTAKTARQDFSVKNRIELGDINGTLTDVRDVKTILKAEGGVFATDTGVLELNGPIQVAATNGMAADLTQATIETKAGRIASSQPVRVQMNDNRIDAQTLEIFQKEKRAIFRGDVVSTLHPPAKTEQSSQQVAPAQDPSQDIGQLMAPDGGPVTVTSRTLLVDDAVGQANFEGDVVARQGDSEIQTAKLDINYQQGGDKDANGDVAAQPAGATRAAAFGAGGAVETIVAPGPLQIRRGEGQTITARRGLFHVKERKAHLTGGVQLANGPDQTATGEEALFDAGQSVAVLNGNVVLLGGRDQRATAQRAEFFTKTDRAMLRGNVVVSQGKNALRGGELFIDRKAGVTRLTTPNGTGPTPGRITAQLQPQTSGNAKASGADKKSTAGGLASFRTDPNAPVEITAGRLDISDAAKRAVFKGDVVARQGDFTMRTIKLTARYSGSASLADASGSLLGANGSAKKPEARKTPTTITSIRADGKVLLTSAGGQKATGDWATFDVAKNAVVLGGDVVLSQGTTVLRGTKLAIDMTSGRGSLTTTAGKPAGGWATTAQGGAAGKVVGTPQGAGTRGGRPSLMFYPGQLQKDRKKKKSEPSANTSGWSTQSRPQ